jgi:hypothetical protein
MAIRRFDDAGAFRQSLDERLRQAAKARSVTVNSLRLKLLMERLLARLFAESESPWLLKGGYAMELRFRPRGRATKDIDLSFAASGSTRSSPTQIAAVRQVLRVSATRDLGDFLVYRVGEAGRLIEAAPLGGARFPIVVMLAGREYGRFHVDVGVGPAAVGQPERLVGDDLLAFAGLAPAVAWAVAREVQFAEKIHAYARPWDDRVNTRTKDLVDLLLLIEGPLPSPEMLRAALRQAFATPPDRPVPRDLPPPPDSWRSDFANLAEEAGLATRELAAAFEELAEYWSLHRLGASGD